MTMRIDSHKDYLEHTEFQPPTEQQSSEQRIKELEGELKEQTKLREQLETEMAWCRAENNSLKNELSSLIEKIKNILNVFIARCIKSEETTAVCRHCYAEQVFDEQKKELVYHHYKDCPILSVEQLLKELQ